MDLKGIKKEAKDALVGNWFMLFIILFVNMLIVSFLTRFGYFGYLLEPIFFAGVYTIIKLMIKDKKVDFNLLVEYFKDLNHAVKLVGVYFLYGLIVLGGLILLIIPGLIFALQYSQSLYIMTDHKDMDIWEVMKKSKEMMKGHKMEFFMFLFSFIGHILLIIITVGIYAIYALPYIKTAMVNYYLKLTSYKQ